MNVPKTPGKLVVVGNVSFGQTSGKKVVIVGDGDCGKTSLVSALANEQFSNSHIPTRSEVDIQFRESDIEGEKFEWEACLYYVKWTILCK